MRMAAEINPNLINSYHSQFIRTSTFVLRTSNFKKVWRVDNSILQALPHGGKQVH
jgi:hypothetical protein